jgi:hypothetical protein
LLNFRAVVENPKRDWGWTASWILIAISLIGFAYLVWQAKK